MKKEIHVGNEIKVVKRKSKKTIGYLIKTKGITAINQLAEQECGELIDLCKKCFALNCVGSFFCDASRPNMHLTGYIDAYNEDEILIKHISPDGYYDGFILIHISDLIRVDILGQYEKRIAALFAIRKQSHPTLNHLNDTLYISIMDFAHTNNVIVSVELEDTTISGFVLDFNECHIHIQVVNENGQTDGEMTVLVENVLSFAVDTSTEQNLKLLNMAQTGQGGQGVGSAVPSGTDE